MSADASVTLLDEELAALVPDVGPSPFLDTLEDRAFDAVLTSASRSLLVRGLAEVRDEVLHPVGWLQDLLRPLGHAPEVRLVDLLQVDDATLTVLRPLPGDVVHLQDVSEDGVHVLTLLTAQDARTQLRHALDPLEVLTGATDLPGAGLPATDLPPAGLPATDLPPAGLAVLDSPDAAVRLQCDPGGDEWSVVTAGGRCWQVDTRAARTDGLQPHHVRALDRSGLEQLLDRLLLPACG